MSSGSRGVRRLVSLTPALLVAVTALFALPQQAGGFRLTKWSAFGLGLAALAVACLVRPPPLRLPRAWLAVGVFVAAAVALPALSSTPALTHWPSALGMLSGLALFFVTVVALADDDEARRSTLVVLTGSGVLCSLVVLLQAAGMRWLTSDVYTGLEFRAPGTFGNPNWAAAYLAPLVPLSLSLAATAKRRWPYHAAAGLLALATLATLSKGGAVTLAAGLLTFFSLGRDVPRRRRVALLAAATAGAGAALAIAWHQDLATQAPWLRGRLFLWRAAFVILSEHPLTGVGVGGYPPAYGAAAAALIEGDPAAFMPLATVDFAHHDLLQFAAEGGVITAGAFVVVVVATLVRAHRQGDPLSRAVGAAVAAIVVNGFADSPLRVPSTFVLFFFLLGWLSPSAPRAGAYRPLLVAIALLGVAQGVRFAAGNTYWTLGRAALGENKPAVAPLSRARFWMPEHGRVASQYARALGRAGRIEEALAASTVAASLRFDFDDEIFRRDLQTRSLDRAAAIRQWQELSARFPALVTPYLRLGALHLRANDRAAAISAYEAAVASPQPTKRAEAARAQARGVLQSLLAKPRRAPP
ncbi:MAG: polymerase [Polyangiaceae bacterium]|jgi:O-antigen ligase|nr:polymerase [Polyangiaceae bacterium]